KIASDSSVLQRFLTEAQAIASLDHKNIVRAYSVDKRGRVYYIAMEYVAGEDLQRTVERIGPLSVETAVKYAIQAAEGLAHAHAQGFVHRDVKPANLLVDAHGTVKILDLGLAKLRRAHGRSVTMEYNDRILGTVDYMAPEQAINSHTVDGLADVYGLGCTFYFLLAGRPPFPNGTIAQRMVQHLHGNRPSLFDVRPDAPGELVRICHRMMSREPRDRITAEQVVLAFREVLTTLPQDGSASVRPPRDWVVVDVGADTKISQAPTLSDSDCENLDEVSSLLASLEEDRDQPPSDPTHAIAYGSETTLADGEYRKSSPPERTPLTAPPAPVAKPSPTAKPTPAASATTNSPAVKSAATPPRVSAAPAPAKIVARSATSAAPSTGPASPSPKTSGPGVSGARGTPRDDAPLEASDGGAAPRAASRDRAARPMLWRGRPLDGDSSGAAPR
ncbi:MAG TPA: protein kinase, partial [Pirellulales bacterium]